MDNRLTPSRPGWQDRAALGGGVSFYIGDASEYATDSKRGWWYWTADQLRFRGPFRSRHLAGLDRKRFNHLAAK